MQPGHAMLSEESYTTLSLGDTCYTLTLNKKLLWTISLSETENIKCISLLLPSSSAPRMAAPLPSTYFPLWGTLNENYQGKSVLPKRFTTLDPNTRLDSKPCSQPLRRMLHIKRSRLHVCLTWGIFRKNLWNLRFQSYERITLQRR